MIGCKVMRTLASVEIGIMLILGFPYCLKSSSVRRLESLPLCHAITLEDPYEAIRQAYLDGTDTESEPFEDPIKTETPESSLTIAPPLFHYLMSTPTHFFLISLQDSTYGCAAATTALSSDPLLFLSMEEVDLPSGRLWGTSKLLEDSEDDDEDEEEDIKESLDSDSVSEDAEDEGPTVKDEDPDVGDEGLAVGVEGLGMDDKSYGLDDESHGMDDEGHGLDDEGHGVESDGLGLKEEEEVVLGGQQQAFLVERTVVSVLLGLRYGALRRQELALEEDHIYSSQANNPPHGTDLEDGMVYIDVPAYPPTAPPVQTSPSPEWTSGSLPISPSPSILPSPVSSPMLPLTIPSPIATPAAVETKGFLTELGAQVEMQEGLIRDHAVQLEELLPSLFERYDRDIRELFTRVVVKFGAIWRPVLALDSWVGQTDAQRAALWHAISDMQGEN
ncbi:hypothetical protein Tco_0951318 [Tanacetum coccineum]|uniref:Uncharacterized protein n=1 Tax=Tanacetum coccineum TaxID=301880 RepID=A0ABQ5DVI9_9ASTR